MNQKLQIAKWFESGWERAIDTRKELWDSLPPDKKKS